LYHIIVSDEFLLMELCEYPLSKGLLKCFKVYLGKPGKYAVFPEAVSEEAM
jgi:hypothetical protein